MLYIDMIKASIEKGEKSTSKVYCCGSSKGFKIGQTGQRYMCQRLQTIRQYEKDVELYAYVEFIGSKALREFIESSVRLYMQGKGYQLQGNDHFIRKGRASTFKRHYMDIVTNTLNALEIDYKVINK
jgi:hypothetical protein